MKQKISLFLTALFVVVILLPITASAHKGKTDAYGGHYDRSTGEYHYHHGFDAHQHYDINGDGIPDCPYDYEDRTNHNRSSSGSSSNYTAITVETKPPEYYTIVKEREVPVYRVPVWVFAVFVLFAAVFFIMYLIIKSKSDTIDNLNKELKKQKLEYEQRILEGKKDVDLLREQIQETKNSISSKYEGEIQTILSELNKKTETHVEEILFIKSSFRNDLQSIDSIFKAIRGDNYLYYLIDVPIGDSVGSDGLPRCGDCTLHKWGYKYTFYISLDRKGTKYHKFDCAHKGKVPINAYSLTLSNIAPCKLCKPYIPDISWYIRYRKIQYFKNKYVNINQFLPLIEDSESKNKRTCGTFLIRSKEE